MERIKILVATHKKYQMPDSDIYLPIHVGKTGKEDLGFQGDNTGENISHKNKNYCELTALFWAWKNLKNVDYIGLVHYRRYFSIDSNIINEEQVRQLIKNYDVILPKKRNYYIESVWSHYEHTQHINDLQETKNIIERKYPQYLKGFNDVMSGKKVHLYNMFIMRKKDFNRYCEWLFDILFELEKKIDISNYDIFHARVFGFVSELLLDVWLSNENMKIKELKVTNIEGVNWALKITKFLIGKFTGYKFSKI
ncbi:DUF4422 domain-containing protein [Heyndrickxia coagulans]|uniref:DUF4422 domain-containing protein n=1 Tax=Heyndrickxia coagulans TaxID=1398 RepID=UPI002DFF65E6|nr:DUF4422 domain-containing protein [Heyndrickxia coagulans]